MHSFTEALVSKPLETIIAYYASCFAASAKAVAFVADEWQLSVSDAAAKQLFGDNWFSSLATIGILCHEFMAFHALVVDSPVALACLAFSTR
jgi:hypothetical protein